MLVIRCCVFCTGRRDRARVDEQGRANFILDNLIAASSTSFILSDTDHEWQTAALLHDLSSGCS